MTSCLIRAVALALSSTTTTGALAAVVYDPIEWKVADGGNGHRYRAVFASERMTWTDAKAMAESLGGHLATLTSEAEANFVFASVARAVAAQPCAALIAAWAFWIDAFAASPSK